MQTHSRTEIRMVDQAFAEKVLRGEIELLGIEEIATRLSVSRPTLERWIRNGKKTTSLAVHYDAGSYGDFKGNFFEGNICFPPPDIVIGKSPKWALATVAKWLVENASKY